ncbi:MAG: aminotransferase class I/II-fold pyridoxal phosphate-dependent enzyme [Candidatus Nealsonbacteria bacterium]
MLKSIFKPISISLSPNTEKDDIWLVFKLFLWGAKRKEGNDILELEKEFKSYLDVRYAFSFNSGRSCLFTILKSLELEQESEVLIQAFTCNAVVNPILWNNLKPNYIDCDKDDFNIDIDDLKKKITPKSKVLIVQHTFGLSANIDEILRIAEQNNLILIEDCAHSLGAEYKGRKVGRFGKVAFFSFSRDKIISSVYGGVITTNDDDLALKINDIYKQTKYPSKYWTNQQVIHPILMNVLILPIYNFLKLGKALLVLFQWLHVFSKAVHYKEKKGERPNYFPKRMPNALAKLALNQFKKLERFNNHRREIADFYFDNLKDSNFILPVDFPQRKNVFLRFTIKNNLAHEIIKQAWKKNLLIGDWYTSPVAPFDTKLEKVGYNMGSCPKAEELSKITFNLPTHINISKNQAQKIINFLKRF